MLAVQTNFSGSFTESTSVFSTFDHDALGRNGHTCTSCSRNFSRAEHLERHLSVHMPTTTSRSFICTYCAKGFTRKDVLTRHIRAVHETKRAEQRKSRRKSCNRCARFKIKCAGGSRGLESSSVFREPCDACKKRGLSCTYDFSVQQADESSEGSRLSASPSGSRSDHSVPSSPGDFPILSRTYSTPVMEPSIEPFSPTRARPEAESKRHQHSISYISLSEGFSDPRRYRSNEIGKGPTSAYHSRHESQDTYGLSTPETSPVSQSTGFDQAHKSHPSLSSSSGFPLPPPTPSSPTHQGHTDLRSYKSSPALHKTWHTSTALPPLPDSQFLKLPPLRQLLGMESQAR